MIREPCSMKNIKNNQNKYSKNVNKSVVFNNDLNFFQKKNKEAPLPENVPIAAAILGTKNTAIPLPTDNYFFQCWTDVDAQQMYINSKPRCYIILSKPGSDAYSLGEALSKKLNCIHLCPRNILIDEIDQQSQTGKCLVFNMRHNKVVQHDDILLILKQKLQSPAVKHRGYIVSGFPLVTTNRKIQCLIDELHEEESLVIAEDLLLDLIYNLKKNRPKRYKGTGSSISSGLQVEEEEVMEEEQEAEQPDEQEEEQLTVELPKFYLLPCNDIIKLKKCHFETKKSILFKQIIEILNLEMKPDIIMYITCPDEDMVCKRNQKYINYVNSSVVVDPFNSIPVVELRWPCKYTSIEYTAPYGTSAFNPKYCCRQPNSFKEYSVRKMCNYRDHVYPYVEKKTKDFDPKFVINIDGRNSVYWMLDQIMKKLISLSINPILLPEPLYMEEPPEDLEEFWNSVEEMNVIRDGVVKFHRFASPWLNRCPVQLKKRLTCKGNPKYAVTFLNNVYLLSTLDSMISFCRNPRPYLNINYLEPTCRFIIIGTKSSGKTMIANCLSWLFDALVVNFNKVLDDEKKKKYDSYSKTILSEIIATIEDRRYLQWQMIENERSHNLETWYDNTVTHLKIYFKMYKDLLQSLDNIEDMFSEHNSKLTELKSILYYLPFLDDVDICTQVLKNKYELLKYAPVELQAPIPNPAIPVLGDEDVTVAISEYIVANELEKEIEPTVEELVTELSKILHSIDEEEQTKSCDEQYGKWIIDDFPSDPDYWSQLSDNKLLPDYTVAIIENREIDIDIIKHYSEIDQAIKHYQERFLMANDPMIKIKLQTKKPVAAITMNMQIIVDEILFHLFEPINAYDPADEIDSSQVTSFSESIDKFRENWDTVKINLEENYKSYVEVEIEHKTDIEILDEVLLKIRKCYNIQCENTEDDEAEDVDEEEEDHDDNIAKHLYTTYNQAIKLCETNIYCPIAYYDYDVLWRGKTEFKTKYNNKMHYFCKEECLETFQTDIVKYQSYNQPFKNLPSLKICVVGCVGSGRTTISKLIAKELGLIHIDFVEIINEILIPKHIKKVGRQYENSFKDMPIDEEAVMDFQIDEDDQNLEADILSNETELRRIVHDYFEQGSPIISILMQKVVKNIWFNERFKSTGFVLDGFPRLSTDVEDMMNCFCIPDLVIELEGSSEITIERLSPIMFNKWKMQLNDAKKIARVKLDEQRSQWLNLITKNVVVNLIYEEILENMFFANIEPVREFSKESTVFDPDPKELLNVDPDLLKVYDKIVQDLPEPIDENVWEKADDAHERIDSRLETLFEVDDENLQSLKDLLYEQKIKVISIDSSKSITKVSRVVLSKLLKLKNRCYSFFEQTFIVSIEIAEMLLLEGFFFLSKFNRVCPVYMYENPFTVINSYNVSKNKNNIFCVIHRSYIYFIITEQNLKKFRYDPLKYINCDNIKSFIEYPLSFGIIGPPKSGKSTLSAKLSKQFGLLCLSEGIAIRNILENLAWTELGKNIAKELKEGHCIGTELITKAIQTTTLDYGSSQGFVFDGFPNTPSEAMKLLSDGIYPLIIFDLESDKQFILENSKNEVYYQIIKYKPPYPSSFIENRFSEWNTNCDFIRDWIRNDIQNIFILKGKSKWEKAFNAENIMKEIMPKINFYLNNVDKRIVQVDGLCIPNEVFHQRMSKFKTLCPACLQENVIRHSNYPVNRKNIIQFQNTFYWICEEHISRVLKQPNSYLSITNFKIPEIPVAVKCVDDTLVYENGICIVTYAENLPNQKILRGTKDFAANYKGKMYLFCGQTCLAKFLAKPHMFFDITVFKSAKVLPEISLKLLPHLGYMEQTLGSIITQACCYINVIRPKYPGLNVKQSALLHIALYLKTKNPSIDKSYLNLYIKAIKVYEARCKLIKDLGLRLRTSDNPFLKHPKCCQKLKTISKQLSSTYSRSSTYSASYADTIDTNL